MASQPRKKTSPNNINKKRTTPRKQTSKKKRTSKKAKSRVKKDILIVLVLIVLVLLGGTGYYFNKNNMSGDEIEEKQEYKRVVAQKEKKPVEVKVREKGKENVKPQSTTVEKQAETLLAARQISKQREAAMSASYEDQSEESISPEKSPVVAPVLNKGKRPKLVIIIDDVAKPEQLKEIQSVPLKLTPSIFPPSRNLISTAKMAKNLKHYMVHFPMQAGNHPRGAMLNTMTVHDSKAKMRARVKDLRKWFPSCVYINNHTGSVFTSDYRALHTMVGLLKEEGFVFVDSRTSPKSKGKRVAKEYGDFYLHRDVFIDNVQKFGTIRKQLKVAVKKAKQRGYAIAIGHPHTMTLRSLKNSLDILVDIDVVYLDELMDQ